MSIPFRGLLATCNRRRWCMYALTFGHVVTSTLFMPNRIKFGKPSKKLDTEERTFVALLPLMCSVSRTLSGGNPGVDGYEVILFQFKLMCFNLCAKEKSGQEATMQPCISSVVNFEYVLNSSVKFMLDIFILCSLRCTRVSLIRVKFGIPKRYKRTLEMQRVRALQ